MVGGWFGRARSEGAAGDWEGKEGILWGMPGESRGTLRAAPCACVELISSPPTPPLLTPSLLSSLPLSRSRVLAAPEESTDSLGTWPRCLFALTYPLLFTATSLVLSLSLSFPLSFPLLHPPLFLYLSIFSSLFFFSRTFSLFTSFVSLSFSSLFAVPYLFLFTLLRLMYSQCRHLLIKLTLSSSFHTPILSILCHICLHPALYLCPAGPSSRFIPFILSRVSPSRPLPPLRRAFHVLRLIFPIQRPLIKLYFANPGGFSEHFGKSRFHGAVAIACFVGSMMRSSRVTCY